MLLVEAPVSATLTAAQEERDQKQEQNNALLRLEESPFVSFYGLVVLVARWELYEAHTTEYRGT